MIRTYRFTDGTTITVSDVRMTERTSRKDDFVLYLQAMIRYHHGNRLAFPGLFDREVTECVKNEVS